MLLALLGLASAHDTHQWTAQRFCVSPDLNLVGDAFIGGTTPLCQLELVATSGVSAGAAWFATGFNLTPVTRIEVQIDVEPGDHDGMTFGLQGVGPSALGTGGAGLGAGGLAGVFLELDTVQNPGDPSANHIGLRNAAGAMLATADAPFPLQSTRTRAWLVWSNPSGTMDVYLSDTPVKPATPILTVPVDLEAEAGGTVYAGFTGATGFFSSPQTVRTFVLEVGRDEDDDGLFDDEDSCVFDPVGADDDDGDGVCNTFDQCLGDDALGDPDGDGICGVPPLPTADTASPDTARPDDTGHTGLLPATADTGSAPEDTAPPTDTDPQDTDHRDTGPQDTDSPDTASGPEDTALYGRRCGCEQGSPVTGWALLVGLVGLRRRVRGAHG